MADPEALYEQGNVIVTATRFVVKGRTFPINGITSVHVERRARPFLAGVVGLAVVVAIGGTLGMLLGILVGLGLFVLTQRNAVCLNTAGRDVTAFETRDRETAHEISEAIGRAVDVRG